jgi:hypothetical protein
MRSPTVLAGCRAYGEGHLVGMCIDGHFCLAIWRQYSVHC